MNPFIKNNQILPIASINSVYVDDILASDLFRPSVLIDIIDSKRTSLGISNQIKGVQLLSEFILKLSGGNDMEKLTAKRLSTDFGDRLARVLLTLKRPTVLSRKNRTNWTKKHWDYWSNIHKIYLVGGMTSPILTKIFYDRIQLCLQNENVNDLQIVFIDGSTDIGTKGLSKRVNDGEFLLFDFGQSTIKKRHIVKKNDEIIIDVVLATSESGFLFYKHLYDEELKIVAKQLNNHIIATIYQSMKEVDFHGDVIHVAIANYVKDGEIYLGRGGYGKLALISDNYGSLLSNELSLLMGREIDVELHHDTSAMAYNFEKEANAAVISLGTAFGVAFIDE